MDGGRRREVEGRKKGGETRRAGTKLRFKAAVSKLLGQNTQNKLHYSL